MSLKKDQIKVSVIVCTYNRANLLPICLDSLVNQTLNTSFYEVIIVDNNSIDQTQSIIDKYKAENTNFLSVQEFNQGLSYARNNGYEQARGEYVAYIDDDACADKNWLKLIVEAFETIIPKPAAVGGIIAPRYISHMPSWACDKYFSFNLGGCRKFLDGDQGAYGFSGSNMSFTKKILQQYNGFKHDYGMIGNKLGIGEEREFFFRIYRDLPYFWYDPDIRTENLVEGNKISLRYWLKRTYVSGVVFTEIENKKYSLFYGAKICLAIFIHTFLMLCLIRLWNPNWKCEFIKKACSIMFLIGKMKTLVQMKLN